MEILLASEYLLPALGGAERFSVELMSALSARHRVRALSLGGRVDDAPAGVECTAVDDPAPGAPEWRRRRLWRQAMEGAVARELGQRPADVVVGQLHTGPAIVRAAHAAGAGAVLLLPSHEALCEYAFLFGSGCRPDSGCRECPMALELCASEREQLADSRAEHDRALREADVLVAPSRAVAAACEAWCGRSPRLAPPVLGAPPGVVGVPGGPVVMAASVWEPQKGGAMIAPLASRLAPRRVLVQWSVSGPPPNLLEDIVAEPNVSVLDPPVPMADLLSGAGVVVVPSQLPEAFGRVAFEAMAAGVPVLASAVGGLKEQVPPAQLVRAIGDPDAWAAAVRRLEDPERWDEARRAGLRAAEAVLALDTLATVEGALAEAASRSRNAPRGGAQPERTGGGAQPERCSGEHRTPLSLTWILAHAYYPSGHADEARVSLRALEAAGMAPAVLDVHDSGDPAGVSAADRRMLATQFARRVPSPFVAVHHHLPTKVAPAGGAVEVSRCMWETDRLPDAWREPLQAYDEVWVPCRHNMETFAAGGIEAERLRLLPEPLDFDLFRPGLEPWPLDVPAGHLVFLSSFDFSERKGWRQLLLAWARAFEAHDPVVLVLKTGSVEVFTPEEVRERIESFLSARLGSARMAPVRLIVEMLPAAEVPRLYAAADAYVCASRGEGWGRTYMEALAMGLPTVGTRYGGNVDFMEREGAWLVDGKMVPVASDADVLDRNYHGHRWLEADVDELAGALREIASDPLAARESAAGARTGLMAEYHPAIFAETVGRYAAGALERWGESSPGLETRAASSSTTRAISEEKTASSKRSAA